MGWYYRLGTTQECHGASACPCGRNRRGCLLALAAPMSLQAPGVVRVSVTSLMTSSQCLLLYDPSFQLSMHDDFTDFWDFIMISMKFSF
jgi:hypothetical protein